MVLTRLDFLRMLAATVMARSPNSRAAADSRRSPELLDAFIARIVRDYDEQGNHRSGTAVDALSAKWLAAELHAVGCLPAVQSFPLQRIHVREAYVRSGTRRVDGMAAFDGGFTGPAGLTGTMSPAGGDGEIGLVVIDFSQPPGSRPDLSKIRSNTSHKALIVVRKTSRPGLFVGNAASTETPFGPPLIQIASDELQWISSAAERRTVVTVVADADRVASESFNVVATVRGSIPSLAPIVVMTPRTCWWTCAVERGTGIACWLHCARSTVGSKQKRDVIFVATGGHELGFLGLRRFLEARTTLAKNAFAWIHFGTGIGAAQSEGNRLQPSDSDLEAVATDIMTEHGIKIDRIRPSNEMPGGEARVIRERGGRYISLQEDSAYFNNSSDRWPTSVDVLATARYARAFAEILETLSNRQAGQ